MSDGRIIPWAFRQGNDENTMRNFALLSFLLLCGCQPSELERQQLYAVTTQNKERLQSNLEECVDGLLSAETQDDRDFWNVQIARSEKALKRLNQIRNGTGVGTGEY
jgi:hypothetical protein